MLSVHGIQRRFVLMVPASAPKAAGAEARHASCVASRAAAPTAALITIGTELVTGDILNDNGRWLAQRLASIGIKVDVVVAIPDDARRIGHIVRWASGDHDLVFVTGGLGATPDDVTREGIARAFGSELAVVDELERELRGRGGHCEAFAHAWARLPVGARLLPRLPDGAPPFAVQNVYVFAGQPREMHAAFDACRAEFPSATPPVVWRQTFRLTEDAAATLLDEVEATFPEVRVGSYPLYAPDGPSLEIVLRAPTSEALAGAANKIRRSLTERERSSSASTIESEVPAGIATWSWARDAAAKVPVEET
jgi:molybdenum cofactor synthesis domain-containing protein